MADDNNNLTIGSAVQLSANAFPRPVKVIKQRKTPEQLAESIDRATDSLLHLLIEANYERAKIIIERLSQDRRRVA